MTTIRRLATLLAVSMCALLGTGMRSSPGAAGSPLRRAFEAGVDSLAESLAALDTSLDARGTGISRAAFRRTRIAYKHQETLLSYFSPSTVSILNGPLGEEDDETPARPLGQLAAFQRVEHRLFSGETLADSDRMALHDDVRWMLDVVVHFRALTGNVDVSESQMLDAARLELARVSVLSLAGVDSDESGDAIIECAEALEGIRSIIAVARGSTEPARWHALDGALGDAIAALRQNTNVETMDRLEFISTHARNVGREILMARETLAPLNLTLRSVWRPAAATLFERNAFDVTAYAPDFALAPSPDVIALGERLFNDPQLSGPRTRSCASCHLPRLAFADGLVRQTSVSGSHAVARNTPTLLNAALQPTLFNDGRVATLEAQVSVVLASPAEMGGSVDLAAARLNADTGYRAAFKRMTRSAAITPNALRATLAAYVRSLVVLDSRFDAAVRGDVRALTAKERNGFTVFMGKGRCGTCHFAPLFGGALPPAFVTSEPEIIGVPTRPDTSHAVLDEDQGRAGVDGIPEHQHAFTVPSLRNVERTAPYMHNGAFATLEQVVDFYNRGGGAGVGAHVPRQTLSTTPLHLTVGEQRDLVAFLKALTDHPRSVDSVSHLHQSLHDQDQ